MFLKKMKSFASRTYMKYVLKTEKVYKNEECELSYLFKPCKKSKKLLVVFSGFPGKGKPPVYNYILKLRSLKCNKLYILDNFGYDSCGSYYLGKNMDFFIARAVTELIGKISLENNIKKEDIITVGSSKGGFASLYFALKNNYGAAISGGAQVLLGDYLKVDKHKHILSYIAGDTGHKQEHFLDNLLLETVMSSTKFPNLYLHVGKREKEDMMHMKYLTDALETKGVKYDLNLGDYDTHGGLGIHFPPYAIQSFKQETNRF